jgi:hypothetical protein
VSILLWLNIHISNARLSSILYYITGHGFGHAVRSSLVIDALKARRPDLSVHVRSTAPGWLFDHSVIRSPLAIDVGMVQGDSLEMNVGATLDSCRRMRERLPAIVEEEIAYIREHDVRLIVGDIPPLCFEIANRASIPSVAVTNFTWEWIYRSYANEHPSFGPLLDEMRRFYSNAVLALALPYACDMRVFSRQECIPWIARQAALDKREARTLFDLPQQAIVILLSFGGLGLKRLSWRKLKKLKQFVFVATDPNAEPHKNLRLLPAQQRHYHKLVCAADVVVTKPGYGIVADIIAHRVPTLCAERTEFPEYFKLAEALRECATAEFISQEQLLQGDLTSHLCRLLEKEQNWPPVNLNGAQVAAEKILAFLE